MESPNKPLTPKQRRELSALVDRRLAMAAADGTVITPLFRERITFLETVLLRRHP